MNLAFDLITSLEPLHPAGSVYHSPLTSKEGVTLTAYLHLKQLLGRTGGKGITAGTNHLGISIILRMNLLLHLCLISVNTNLSLVLAGRLELDYAINQGKEGVVLAHPHIVAWVDASAPLPD